MNNTVKVICENDGSVLYINMGSSLEQVVDMLSASESRQYIACYVNNEIQELTYRVYNPASIRFIDTSHFEGMKIYARTLFFALDKVISDLYPSNPLYIKHSVSKGFYCEIQGIDDISFEEIENIKKRMDSVIAQDIPIIKESKLSSEVAELYQKMGLTDKLELLESRPHLYVDMYSLANVVGNFYGVLAPSTGYLGLYDIRKYFNGLYLAIPKRTDSQSLEPMIDQEKMFEVFSQHQHWVQVIGVSNLGSLNNKILAGEQRDLINMAEAFHEKKVSEIAEKINKANKAKGTKVVFIAGPSSSGKTTFSKQLAIQLSILGFKPSLVSMDDYFVDRDKTPVDEKGEFDYEALEAVDVELFNEHLNLLLEGESVVLPRYDFISGTRKQQNKPMTLDENSVLIIEGIHGLNPKLTEKVDDRYLYKIYISALTSISLDNLSRISTTDNRLIRRLVRDFNTRGADAVATLHRWPSVRKGEDKHIFPYQENADVMFNSSLFYEISVLKHFVTPLLHSVPDTVPEYSEARRILKFLDNFCSMSPDFIPPTSVIREFIGNSSFLY